MARAKAVVVGEQVTNTRKARRSTRGTVRRTRPNSTVRVNKSHLTFLRTFVLRGFKGKHKGVEYATRVKPYNPLFRMVIPFLT